MYAASSTTNPLNPDPNHNLIKLKPDPTDPKLFTHTLKACPYTLHDSCPSMPSRRNLEPLNSEILGDLRV